MRFTKDERRHEFIRLVFCVLRSERICWGVFALFAATQNNGIPGALRPIPTSVAVHRKISTNHGDDFCAARLKSFRAGR